MTPLPADSPVGKGDVVRILQYGVREGGEAEATGELVKNMFAECKLPLILPGG